MKLDYREFETRDALEAAARTLLTEALTTPTPTPRAVMLTGGNTPFGVYNAIAQSGKTAHPGVHVFLSDDRYVPRDSPDSNAGRLRPMLEALAVQHTLAVDTQVPIAVAAERYARDLQALRDAHIPITLGILGLGADGHVAALFDAEQLAQGRDRLAIAVKRPDGMTGVSTTPPLLCAARKLVFWVAGPDKRQAVQNLRHQPRQIPAGLALDDAPDVALWYAPY